MDADDLPFAAEGVCGDHGLAVCADVDDDDAVFGGGFGDGVDVVVGEDVVYDWVLVGCGRGVGDEGEERGEGGLLGRGGRRGVEGGVAGGWCEGCVGGRSGRGEGWDGGGGEGRRVGVLLRVRGGHGLWW